MIKIYGAEYNNIRIRPIVETDIEKLRVWRNNADISKFLRPVGEITKEMQKAWYDEYERDDKMLTFAIEETKDLKRMVGSVAFYEYEGEESKIGKTVVGDPEAKGKSVGFWGELLALYLGFERYGVKIFRTEVHEKNIASQKMITKHGFIKTGKRKAFDGGIEDEMTKERLMEVHPYLNESCIFCISHKE